MVPLMVKTGLPPLPSAPLLLTIPLGKALAHPKGLRYANRSPSRGTSYPLGRGQSRATDLALRHQPWSTLGSLRFCGSGCV
jgi:hypothetical protein